MQFLIFAFALFFVAIGQQTPVETPTPTPDIGTPTPVATPTPTPAPSPSEPSAAEIVSSLSAFSSENVTAALDARGFNLSGVGNITVNDTVVSYESVDSPPSPNATFWAEQLQSVLCEFLNFTDQQCSDRLNGTLYTPPQAVNGTFLPLKRVINPDNWRVDFLISDPAVVVPVVTPTPTETPTPAGTPTPEGTPTPTPVVTPTPTPSPSPSPVVVGCFTQCEEPFNTATETPNWANAGYTTQCQAWETQISCLRDCTPAEAAPNDEATRIQQCLDTQYVGDFCRCNLVDKAVDGAAVVAASNNFQNVFIAKLRTFAGVDPTADVIWPTDQQGNTFKFTFVWDNEAQLPNNGGTVTEAYLADQVRSFLADFFNTDAANLQVVTCDAKRAQQTTTFCVTYIETGQTGGVATFTMSIAFVLVSFLMNALF